MPSLPGRPISFDGQFFGPGSAQLELTRFGGHLQSRGRRCLHDQETQSVEGGVPREAGAAVEEGAKLVWPFKGVWSIAADNHQLGSAGGS